MVIGALCAEYEVKNMRKIQTVNYQFVCCIVEKDKYNEWSYL